MASEVVVVDDREPDGAGQRLRDFGLVPIEGHLEAGDYAFYPHGFTVLVERKTVSNLLGSLASKQMVSQAHKLVQGSDRCFLLREGEFRRHPSGRISYFSPRDPRADGDGWVLSGWSWDSFTGMMIDLQLMGIDFLDCPVMGEYPMEIARLVVNLSKNEHRWIRERERPEVISIDPQYVNAIWSLSAFKGIGPEVAEALLREYGNVARVITEVATCPKKIAKVKVGKASFGEKRALRFHDEVLQNWSS